jgi:hypothetical protein
MFAPAPSRPQRISQTRFRQRAVTLAGNGTNGTGGAGKGKKSTPESGSGTEAMTQAQFVTRLQSLVSEAETSGLNKLSMTTALQDQAEALQLQDQAQALP